MHFEGAGLSDPCQGGMKQTVELKYLNSPLDTVVQFRGEAPLAAALGDGVRSSWSGALHCVLCHGADDGQTAAGHGQ